VTCVFNPKNALINLARLASWKPERVVLLEEFLRADLPGRACAAVEVAEELGEPLASTLTRLVENAHDLNLAARLRRQDRLKSVALRSLKWVVAEQCLEAEGSAEERNYAQIGTCLFDVCVALSELGRREEALQYARKCVEAYQQHVTAVGGDSSLELADALSTLANMLADLGLRNDALSAARASLNLHRRLCATGVGDKAGLARALNNLAVKLYNSQQHKEAVAAAREAQLLFEELEDAGGAGTEFKSDRVPILNTLANALFSSGDLDGALKVADNVVRICEELYFDYSETFKPEFARAHLTLGNVLLAKGQIPLAIDSTRKAGALYHELADVIPATYAPKEAMALGNLAVMHLQLERFEEALDAAQQARVIYEQTAPKNLSAVLPNLCDIHKTISIIQAQMNRLEDAIDSVRQGIDCFYKMDQLQREERNMDLASCLMLEARFFGELRRYEEALRPAREAVDIYTQLFETDSERFRQDLAEALRITAFLFRDAGNFWQALKSMNMRRTILAGCS